MCFAAHNHAQGDREARLQLYSFLKMSASLRAVLVVEDLEVRKTALTVMQWVDTKSETHIHKFFHCSTCLRKLKTAALGNYTCIHFKVGFSDRGVLRRSVLQKTFPRA